MHRELNAIAPELMHNLVPIRPKCMENHLRASHSFGERGFFSVQRGHGGRGDGDQWQRHRGMDLRYRLSAAYRLADRLSILLIDRRRMFVSPSGIT